MLFSCGDRIIFNVPNENFKQVLLEIGEIDGPWRYVEIEYPFVMLYQQDLDTVLQVLGERGDRLAYRPDLDQWGVKNLAS